MACGEEEWKEAKKEKPLAHCATTFLRDPIGFIWLHRLAELILRMVGQRSFQHFFGWRALAFPWLSWLCLGFLCVYISVSISLSISLSLSLSLCFEGLSNHCLVGGRLKMVGRGPAQPHNHFKMSSDGDGEGRSSISFAGQKLAGLRTRVVLIGLIKTTSVVLIRPIKGL